MCKISPEKYEKLKNDPRYCLNCAVEILFSTLSNKDLKTVLFEDPPQSLIKFVSKQFVELQIEKLSSQLFDQSENLVSCDYFIPLELNKIKVK